MLFYQLTDTIRDNARGRRGQKSALLLTAQGRRQIVDVLLDRPRIFISHRSLAGRHSQIRNSDLSHGPAGEGAKLSQIHRPRDTSTRSGKSAQPILDVGRV